MDKQKKLIKICYIFNIILIAVVVLIRFRLSGTFEMPDQSSYLMNLQIHYKIALGMAVVSIFFTIIHVLSVRDLNETVSHLYKKVLALEKETKDN